MKKNLSNKLKIPYLALLIVTLIWSAAGPVIKYTLQYIPPLHFIFYRFLIACLIIFPFAVYELQRTKINPKDYSKLIAFGVLSQGSIAILFLGLNLTTALDATIIGIICSVLSIYAGHFFYKDKIDKKIVFGLLLASAGTLLVVLEPFLSDGHGFEANFKRVFGNILVVIQSLSHLLFIVWSKMGMGEKSVKLKNFLSKAKITPLTKNYSPALITTISFYVGMVVVLPFAVIEKTQPQYTAYNIFNTPSVGIMGLLYMALISSIVAYLLYQWSLEYLTVSETAFFGYLSPIFTFPFAYLLLKEIPNIYMIVGSIFIAIGILIAERENIKTKNNL